MPHKNPKDRKQYQKQWRESHPDYQKGWRESHPGYQKQWMESSGYKKKPETWRRWYANLPLEKKKARDKAAGKYGELPRR